MAWFRSLACLYAYLFVYYLIFAIFFSLLFLVVVVVAVVGHSVRLLECSILYFVVKFV